MLCEDFVSSTCEVFVCVPKINYRQLALRDRLTGVIFVTYGYILRGSFGYFFHIGVGDAIEISAAEDEESNSSRLGQLLARCLSSVRQTL